MPGTVLGVREAEIPQTQPLASGISESRGGGRWTQTINMTTAVMKARTRSSEVPRRAGHSEGLAEDGGWSWPSGVGMRLSGGRMWKGVVGESIPSRKKL